MGNRGKGKGGRIVDLGLVILGNENIPGLRKGLPQVRAVGLTGRRRPWEKTALLGSPALPQGPLGFPAIFGAIAAGVKA